MSTLVKSILQKPIKINLATVVFVFLVFVVILESLQIYSQNRQLSMMRFTNLNFQKKINEMGQEQSRLRNVDTLTPNIFSFDAINSAKTGWVKYHNEKLGLSFEYPIDRLKLEEVRQITKEKETISISLFTKKNKDLDNNPVLLLEFSNFYSPMTYGDINEPESIDEAAYLLQGKKYDVLNFGMGEGSQCGGGNVKTALIKLRENLMIYKMEMNQQRNKDRENCIGDAYDEFKTSANDMKLADSIIKTVEFEK